MSKKSASKARSKSPANQPTNQSRSKSRGRSPTPKRTLNSVATPDRYINSKLGLGLRKRPPVTAEGEGLGTCGGEMEKKEWKGGGSRAGGLKELIRCLLNPAAAKDIPLNSAALRTLEAASLLLNLAAFYLIVSLNKTLFKDREKGGYGLKGVATLTFFQYITSWFMLNASGVTPKPFERDEWAKRLLLIVIFGIAPLASNMSLMLNPVSTYQLFKLLQTPLLAVVEWTSGFRGLSFFRALLMVGVTAGVGLAEIGGDTLPSLQDLIQQHDTNKDLRWDEMEFNAFKAANLHQEHLRPILFEQLDVAQKDRYISGDEFARLSPPVPVSRVEGLVWAGLAVVLASAFKMFTGKLVRRGMTPAQFLLNLLPYSGALLLAYALVFERSTFHLLLASPEEGGLGSYGIVIFVLSGLAAYFVQFTQAVAVGTTSALSHALIGQAKTASMLLLSPIIYGEATTSRQLLGGASAMVCLVLYVYVNVREMEAEAASKPRTKSASIKTLSSRGRSPGALKVTVSVTTPDASYKKLVPFSPNA